MGGWSVTSRACATVDGRQYALRGLLLGTTSARAAALARKPQRRHLAGDVERLRVSLSLDPLHLVPRQREPAGLQVFLQTSLGVLELARGRKGRDPRLEQPSDHDFGHREAAIHIKCPKDSFQGIGENGLTAKAPGLELAGAELQ